MLDQVECGQQIEQRCSVVVSRIFNMHIEVAANDDWTSVCNQHLQNVGQLSEERAERRARWSVDAQNDEGSATDEKPEAQSFERRQSWQPDGDRSGSANRIGSARICNFFAVRTN